VAGRLPGRAGDARREAGGLWSAGRETGEGRERAERVERKREREICLISNLNLSQNFQLTLEKF